MEISGIPANITTSYSGSDSTVSGAMQSSMTKLEESMKNMEKYGEESVDYLAKIHKILDEPSTSRGSTSATNSANNATIIENTIALRSLADLISTKQFTLKLEGNSATYFYKMLNAMTDDKAIIAIDKFSKAFDATVRGMAQLDRFSGKINNLAGALTGAMGSFKEIGKGLMFLAGGIAILGVALATFMQVITPEALLAFGAIILTLRLAGEISEGATMDFAKLSVSVALLGISIWAFTELIDAERTIQFAGTLIAITGAMWVMSKLSGPIAKQSANMLRASAAIAIMAGSMWIFGKVVSTFQKIDVDNTIAMGLAIGGFALVYEAIGHMGITILAQGALGVAAIGGSMWILAKGLNDMNQVKMSLERGLAIAAMMVGAAGVIALIGNPVTAPFIITGAALTGALAASLWLLAMGLNNITKVKVTPDQALSFADSLKNTIGAIATLGNPLNAIPIAISTPIALALAASTLGVYGAMMAVSKMPPLKPEQFQNFKTGLSLMLDAFKGFVTVNSAVAIAAVPVATALAASTWMTMKAMNNVINSKVLLPEVADNFKYGVKVLLDSFSQIGLSSGAKAVASVPVMAAIVTSTTFVRGAIWMVSKMKMLTEEQGEGFKKNIEYLIDAYSNITSGQLSKAIYSAGALTLITSTTMAATTFLRGFQSFNLDKQKIETNVDAFGSFFSSITKVFVDTEPQFDKITRGVRAFSGISALTRGLAKTVRSFANLTFDEHEVVNGKIVVTGTTRLTPKDLQQVGISIGSMLNALTSPLANIGSSKDSYSIGGFTVTNPFSNTVKSGIVAMSKISTILKPITDSVLSFTANGIDRAAINTFSWSLATILTTMSVAFKRSADEVRRSDMTNLQESIGMVHKLNAAVGMPNFKDGVGSFTTYTKDLAMVKSTINDLNLEKLNKLTMMLGHLAELNRTQGLKALIDSFKQFIEVFVDYTNTRDREIKIQEQRQMEVDELQQRSMQMAADQQNTSGSGIIMTNPLQQQLSNIQSSVNKAGSGAVDPAITTELNKIYKKIEAMYNDMFIYNKSINVVIGPERK